MKITLIGVAYPHRGGISHYSSLLARQLLAKHTLQFISFKRLYPRFLFPGTTQLDLSKEKIVVPSLPLLDSLNPISWINCFLKIKAFQPTLVIFNWWHPITAFSYSTISLLCKKFVSLQVIFLCHNIFPHESFPLSKIIAKMALSKADGFIVQATTAFEKLKKAFPQKEIIQVYHPLYMVFRDNALEKDSARKVLSLQQGEKMVLFFGIIRRYKGLRYLLEAIPYIISKITCKFFIVGEFYEDKEVYLEQIRKAELESHITLINRYIPNEEVGYYFSACDVVVLPYEDTTQSGIIQIAFAFDRPVITTSVGGLPEVVEHGVTGYLVPPRNPEALAQAVLTFYRENKEIEFQENIKKTKTKFSWSRLVKVIEDFGNPDRDKRNNPQFFRRCPPAQIE
jgi:glycosyltransferase involved in cell wall biosynthesis